MSRQPVGQIDIGSVRAEIVRLFFTTGQPALEQVAKALGISPRTLQRRLADKGLTFRQVVSEMRFITARQLILEKQKITDVARRLGYSDAGSFTRAFERWTGLSPRQYRARFCRNSLVRKKIYG